MSPNQPFDFHQARKVAIFVPDSSSSIGTRSPTLLIPESSQRDASRSSLASSHGTLTVKFAPLPQIDPNRKRSLAPLGVPGRSRRKRPKRREGGSLLWAVDPDMPDENAEDPIILLAKLVKKTGKTLWRRVRKGSRTVQQESFAEPVLDIKSVAGSVDMVLGNEGERVSEMAVGLGDKRGRPASWSPPSVERRTLSWDRTRRSTSDLPHLSVIP